MNTSNFLERTVNIKMKILLCNDDGVRTPGIVLLANRMAELGHSITVVAPERERSGAGHSVTLTSMHIERKLFPEYNKCVQTFQCSGTPADCAMLGLAVTAPDAELLISGINAGPNLGCDVFYSGTVAAAREGYFENRWGIAISLAVRRDDRATHYETAVRVIENLLANTDVLFEKNKPALLNVNVPNRPFSEIKGFKAAFAGRCHFRNRIKTSEVRGEEHYYWLHGELADDEELEGSDIKAVNDGFVALTFLQHDTTDHVLTHTLQLKAKDVLGENME